MNSIVSYSNDNTTLAVVGAMNASGHFEVQCTNDYVDIEKFKYDKKEIAIEVAKSQTIHFREVVVNAVLEYVGDWDKDAGRHPVKRFERTIYQHVVDDEDVVLTADGAVKGGEEE